MSAPNPQTMVVSYTRVRTALGILGMLLPVILIVGALCVGDGGLEPSLSDFYHTIFRDLFVGTLIAIGVFLVAYRGHVRQSGERVSDNVLATLAGIGAFGTALFPNEIPNSILEQYGALADPSKLTEIPPETVSQYMLGVQISPYFHYVSATLFFGCLALFCFVKFAANARVTWRRRVYIACGCVIVGALALALVASMTKAFGAPEGRAVAFVKGTPLIFWLESIGVWAFGVSWLIKGKADHAAVAFALRKLGNRR